MMKYAHIARWFAGSLWAITEDKLAILSDTLAYLMAGGQMSDDDIARIVAANPGRPRRIVGDIAVLPILGTISHRAGMMGESSGGTSVEAFTVGFRQVVADPNVGGVVLDVESPGGVVDGVPELADEIFAARDVKPIIAVANSAADSAAYWLASSAGEFSVTPSGEVGSIGVLAVHQDESAFLERMGVKMTMVKAGMFKGEMNPFEPLSDDARGALQERVDDAYGMFVGAVARNRGVSVADVRGGFGQGRVVTARQAKAMGMVDRIETLDEAIERMRRRGGKMMRGTSAALERQRYQLATI